jgi:hypothetical protein
MSVMTTVPLPPPSGRRGRTAALAAVLAVLSARGDAAVLQDQTRLAFERYVQATEARMERELTAPDPLWVDRQPGPERPAIWRRLRGGEVVVTRLETRAAGAPRNVPDGLAHHWLGTVFIPGATVARAIAMVQDYDRYAEIYDPAVRRATLVARDGPRFTASMQLFMKKIVSVVLNVDVEVLYRNLGPTRTFVASTATRIAEVDDADGPAPREKPVGSDSGYLWRFNNYCLFDEREGGTVMQCESLSLSRDVPLGLGWVVGPFVSSIPRESLTSTLVAARAYLVARRP